MQQSRRAIPARVLAVLHVRPSHEAGARCSGGRVSCEAGQTARALRGKTTF